MIKLMVMLMTTLVMMMALSTFKHCSFPRSTYF